MKVLIALLAVVVCVVAEPYFLDYPYYNYAYKSPISPLREIIPEVYPLGGYSLPYYAGLKSQYDIRDYLGQARYGHVEPGQSHHAVQDIYGNKIGAFSYYNAEGKLKHTSYIADAAGYRVSSNDLPVDTLAVSAAKAEHFAEHLKIKLRSKRDVLLTSPISHIDYRIAAPIPHAFPTTRTIPVVKPDGYLADTPEVTAAKSLHYSHWETAKARNYSPFYPLGYRYASYPYLY